MRAEAAPDSDYIARNLYIDLDDIESSGRDCVCYFRLKVSTAVLAAANIYIRDSSDATIYSYTTSSGSKETSLMLMWDDTNSEWTILSTYTN